MFAQTGNPPVQFGGNISPNFPTVSLDGNFVPVLGDRFYYSDVTDEMLHLTSDLTDANCDNALVPGAPARVIVGTTNDAAGTKYWIHTTSFELQNNDIDSPLVDGGKAAMSSTADAPNERMRLVCASAPRTFMNENHCVMSDDACYEQEGPDVDIALTTTNLQKILVRFYRSELTCPLLFVFSLLIFVQHISPTGCHWRSGGDPNSLCLRHSRPPY